MLLTDQPRLPTQRLHGWLAQVEQRFDAELLSDLPCVGALTAHVGRYRGKMLRPSLLGLCGWAGWPGRFDTDEATEPLTIAAAVIEMVHMATLVHDDVLDEADVRRRGSTINRLRGNEAAVMMGDYLISHAYHLCSALGRADVSRAVAAATNTVCEGELLQLEHREDWDLTERVYFEVIRRKTAALCAVACRLPALLADDDPHGERADALAGYGEKLGLAFQMIDDVLDLTGEAATVGKTLGRDLAKGKLTLPLILWRDADSGRYAGDRRATLTDAAAAGDASAVRAAVLAAGTVEKTRDWARRLAREAADRLAGVLAPSPEAALLLAMADAVVAREA